MSKTESAQSEQDQKQKRNKKKRRKPMTFKRQIKRLGILLLCAYLLIFVLAAFFSDKLMFPAPECSYHASFPGLVKIPTADGGSITAMYLEHPKAEYTILYSHGNGEDIGTSLFACERIQQAGFNVLLYDYRGYGTSEGTPTEQTVYADIQAAYDYLTGSRGIAPERIIVHGRSIGSGPSVDLASRQDVGGLIIQSGFTSAFRVPLRIPLLPWDKFDNLSKLPQVNCPVLVIHGLDDWIISSWHGKKLYQAAPKPKQHLWIDGAGHNDLVQVAGERYTDAIREFAKSLSLSAWDLSRVGRTSTSSRTFPPYAMDAAQKAPHVNAGL